MSLFFAASRRVSAFRGMTAALSLIAALLVVSSAVPALADDPGPAATQAAQGAVPTAPPAATTGIMPMAPPAPAAVAAALPVPVPPPASQATMSIAWPMPPFAAGRPPQIIEPVAVAACRQCREGCFRDYGAQCNDDTCRRSLPICMRNCWQAICR